MKEIFKHDPFELDKISCSNGFFSFFRLWHGFVVLKAVAKGWAANPKKPRAVLENCLFSLKALKPFPYQSIFSTLDINCKNKVWMLFFKTFFCNRYLTCDTLWLSESLALKLSMMDRKLLLLRDATKLLCSKALLL